MYAAGDRPVGGSFDFDNNDPLSILVDDPCRVTRSCPVTSMSRWGDGRLEITAGDYAGCLVVAVRGKSCVSGQGCSIRDRPGPARPRVCLFLENCELFHWTMLTSAANLVTGGYIVAVTFGGEASCNL